MVNVQLTVTALCDIEGVDNPEAVLTEQVRPQIEALGLAGSAFRIRIMDVKLADVEIDRRYEDRTVEELYDIAQERGIAGRSNMSKAELVAALSRGS